jgi:IstB-like ATP binding protein
VQADCAIEIDGSAYSVPWRLIGETVRATIVDGMVRIHHGNREVAVHPVCSGRRRRTAWRWQDPSEVALGREAILAGHSVQFVAATSVVADSPRATTKDGSRSGSRILPSRSSRSSTNSAICPLSPMPHNSSSSWSVAVTSGARSCSPATRRVGEWGVVFGDPVVATAILDRLLHHSHVITIRGDSYRLKEKRRSGLLQKPTAEKKT